MKTLPYMCKFCGAGSYLEPCDQSAPPDYCHESDHGSVEDYRPEFILSAMGDMVFDGDESYDEMLVQLHAERR